MLGASHVQDSANFVRNSNGKVRFGFFRPGNQPVCGAIKPVDSPASLHLGREFGKEIKKGRSRSSWLDRLDRKMSFHLPRVFHNESTRHDYCDPMVFKKLRLQNVFHMKTKSQRFQIPPVLEAFPKSRNFVIASSYVLTPYSCNTTANTRAPPPLPQHSPWFLTFNLFSFSSQSVRWR